MGPQRDQPRVQLLSCVGPEGRNTKSEHLSTVFYIFLLHIYHENLWKFMVCTTRNHYQHLGISLWVTRLQHKGHQGFYSTDSAGTGILARARMGMISSVVKSWAVTGQSLQEPLGPPRLRGNSALPQLEAQLCARGTNPTFLLFCSSPALGRHNPKPAGPELSWGLPGYSEGCKA